jgi:hypothetical protein
MVIKPGYEKSYIKIKGKKLNHEGDHPNEKHI